MMTGEEWRPANDCGASGGGMVGNKDQWAWMSRIIYVYSDANCGLRAITYKVIG